MRIRSSTLIKCGELQTNSRKKQERQQKNKKLDEGEEGGRMSLKKTGW